MNVMIKEVVNTFKGKVPDIVIWIILGIIAIVILQKDGEIQDIQIVEAQNEIQTVKEESEKDRNEILDELKAINSSIKENSKNEREHYEELIQRLSKLEK